MIEINKENNSRLRTNSELNILQNDIEKIKDIKYNKADSVKEMMNIMLRFNFDNTDPYESFCAIEKDSTSLVFINNPSMEMCILAVRDIPELLKIIKNPGKELYLEALKSHPLYISEIPVSALTEDIILKVLNSLSILDKPVILEILSYVSNSRLMTANIFKYAINKYSTFLQDIFKIIDIRYQTKEIVDMGLNKTYGILKYIRKDLINMNDNNIWFDAIEENPLSYKDALECIGKDNIIIDKITKLAVDSAFKKIQRESTKITSDIDYIIGKYLDYSIFTEDMKQSLVCKLLGDSISYINDIPLKYRDIDMVCLASESGIYIADFNSIKDKLTFVQRIKIKRANKKAIKEKYDV